MPDAKPRRPRRWLRRLIVAVVLAAVAFGIVTFLAVRNLEWIATWSIHRLFPGVRADLGALRIVSATRLEVRKLTLKSSKTGEPLLALEDGSVTFSFSDVWRLRLDEVQLQKPDLIVSPGLGEALGVQPSTTKPGAKSSGGLGWGIGRLAVNAGHLRVTRFGEQSPTVDMDFSADFENFGVGGDAAKVEHSARLENIIATDKTGSPFLKIADADIRFSTEELFGGSRVRGVRIGEGKLTVAPDLLNLLAPGPKATAATAASAPSDESPGWSVGSLQLDGIKVIVINAPGPIGRVEFRIAVALQDIGGSSSPQANAWQRVTLTGVKVSTDLEPKISLLVAKEAETTFTVAGLVQRRIESLVLKDPDIDFAPGALQTPSAKTAAATTPSPGSAPAPGWLVVRAACKYGTLRLRGLKDGTLDISTRFAFDVHNFGTLGDAVNASQELTVWDAQASNGSAKAFLSVDAAQVRFTTAGLFDRQRIDAVKITGGRLLVGDAFQKLLAGDAPPPPQSSTPAATPAVPSGGWSIGALDISGLRLRLEDKRVGVPDVRMTLNTSLRDVAATGVSSQLFDQVQTVELANIDLNSPLNRAAKIFTLRSVFVRFTLRDLAAKHLQEVILREPVIYLSRDLFVYMERAGAPAEVAKPAGQAQAAPLGPDWSADHVEVKNGKLVIGSGGQKDVGLPLEFETTLDNVALDNLAELKVQAALRVPRQSHEFADYQISVRDVEGDLRFAYPPEKGEKNLVQKLEIREIRWRQFQSIKDWIAVTFDAKGINGQFGGESYRGYVNGGFSFNFLEDSPWQGWVSGTDVDTQALTSVMSPQNFSLTGPLDFEVQLDAFRKEISRMVGVFHVKQPGRLKIGKLDEILSNVPPDWLAIKKSTTRIALETLRDFDYTTANGDFWFVDSQGILGLNLTGPLGSRRFEVALHDDQETKNQWQQGKLGTR